MPNKTIGLERDLYKKLKREIKTISWIRLENRVLLGTPDLLAYSSNGNFFTLELKRTKSIKVQLSPHQVSFHMKHKTNTFVLVACALKLGSYRLYPGHRILELVDSGLKLEPLCAGWEACRLKLESL
jgi:Holliday junction resolvase|tara:strand:+ start:472 stop:852 length:381 start_codon:yes stop_codon:yes gene_type:complete